MNSLLIPKVNSLCKKLYMLTFTRRYAAARFLLTLNDLIKFYEDRLCLLLLYAAFGMIDNWINYMLA